jgi:hypothetical protein
LNPAESFALPVRLLGGVNVALKGEDARLVSDALELHGDGGGPQDDAAAFHPRLPEVPLPLDHDLLSIGLNAARLQRPHIDEHAKRPPRTNKGSFGFLPPACHLGSLDVVSKSELKPKVLLRNSVHAAPGRPAGAL